MKVAVVSQYFPPEPSRIPRTLSAHLRSQGHEVAVITAFPNYPGGKVYPGYRLRWSSTEVLETGTVRRTYVYPSHDRSTLRRVMTYLSFAVSSTIAGWRMMRSADVVYVYGSPATAALGPFLNSRISRVPYVVHVQDLWPDSVVSSGFLRRGLGSRLVGRGLGAFTAAVYGGAAAVVAIAPTMTKTLASRGIATDRLHTILNWSDEGTGLDGTGRRPLRRSLGLEDGDIVLMYAGNVGPMQSLDVVLAAFSRLPLDSPLKLVIVGSGISAEDLVLQSQRVGLGDRVLFLGRRDASEMPRINAIADVQLVALKDLDFLHGTIPGKFPEILANRQPMLCAVPGDAAGYIQDADAGWGSDLTCSSISDTLAEIVLARDRLKEMGENAGLLYSSLFTQSVGLARLTDVLKAIANTRKLVHDRDA